MDKSPEIVITGLGIVSSIGSGIEAFWSSITAGACGIAPFDISTPEALVECGLPSALTGEVKELDKKRIRPRKSIKVMARDIQVGVAASDYAWEDARLNEIPVDPERQGIVFGAIMIMVDLEELIPLYASARDEENQFIESKFGDAMDRMYPLWMLKYLPNMTACHIGVANDLRGPSNTVVCGDLGGLESLIEASRVLTRGAADLMYTGGCNSSAKPQCVSSFQKYIRSKGVESSTAYQPFDSNREGIIFAECAGTTIIETRESAEKRGVPVYGTFLGYAETSEPVWGLGTDFAAQKEDVILDVEKFTGKSIVNAAKLALERANVKPEDLAFVMAHGLGTQFHDRMEAEAIASVVGSEVPVTCVTAATGYAFSGSSAAAVVASVLALKNGVIPPIANCTSPDPACPVKLVTGQPMETDKKAALILAYNSSGQAAAVVIGK